MEFLKSKNITTHYPLYDKKTQDFLKLYFHHYLTEGGFPEITHYSADVRQDTLQNYIDLVIYRDIIERFDIKNPSVIKYMILTMLHNVSNVFSINKFYNDLKSQGYKVSKDTLYDYANYIEDAYLIFPVKLYDKSIRKTQVNPQKLYAVDCGLVRATTLSDRDYGKSFENIIYLELRRKKCHINYYLTANRFKVDFLIKNPQGQKKLLQVTWDMSDHKTYERELRALEEAKKELNIPGEIITVDAFLRDGLLELNFR